MKVLSVDALIIAPRVADESKSLKIRMLSPFVANSNAMLFLPAHTGWKFVAGSFLNVNFRP